MDWGEARFVFGRSKAKCFESFAVRWLAVALASVGKATIEGQLEEFTVTSYLVLLLFLQKNYLK